MLLFVFFSFLPPTRENGIREKTKTDWMRTETPQMGKYSHEILFFPFLGLSLVSIISGYSGLSCYNGYLNVAVAYVFFLSLHHQFEENKVAWVAGLATIGAVEFMAAAVALFILRRLQVAIQNYRLWRHSRWISLVSCYDRRL